MSHQSDLPPHVPSCVSTGAGVTVPDATATPRTDAFYVVTAYRWGQRNAHSFVVGAYIGVSAAIRCAEEYADYRGGKYACEVVKAWAWSEDEDCVGNQVHYIESPYYGLAHDGGHFHPADCSKRGRPSAKPFTVRELQNRVGDLERELTAAKAEIAYVREESATHEHFKGEAYKIADTWKDRAERAEAQLRERTQWQCKCGGTDCAGQAENERLRARVAELEQDKARLLSALERWMREWNLCSQEQREVGHSEMNVTAGLVCDTNAAIDAARAGKGAT